VNLNLEIIEKSFTQDNKGFIARVVIGIIYGC